MTESHIESKLREYSMIKVDAEMTESTDFDEKKSEKFRNDRDIRVYLFRVHQFFNIKFLSKCM